MNITNIQISCLSKETDSKSLSTLGALLFLAAEILERRLTLRGTLEHEDRLVWDIKVDGPDWDYLATGDVSWMRGSNQIGISQVSFHDGRMAIGGNRKGAPVESTLVNELAGRLESQVLLAL